MEKFNYEKQFGTLVSVDLAVAIIVDFLLKEGNLKPFIRNCFIYKKNGYDEAKTMEGVELDYIPSNEEILEELRYKLKTVGRIHYSDSFPLGEVWGYYTGSFAWIKSHEGQRYWATLKDRFRRAVDGIKVENPKKA
jgi:hypothetical protein